MPPTSLLQRLKLRHKIAALGVVGMALLVLPLVQLFRYQGLELQWAEAERERAEPGLLAVSLQRGLVDHGLAARLVLAGQGQHDSLRREHQATVDARLEMLAFRLAHSPHDTAEREVRSMRPDWQKLVQRVAQKRCTVQESELAHRLLVEQTLQVIDIVSAGLPVPADTRLATLLGPLPHALAQAERNQQPAAMQALSETAARLQAQVQAGLETRMAWHRAQRALAGCGLLALVLAMLGTAAWLRRSLANPAQPVQGPGGPALRDTGPWQAASLDGQLPARQAQAGLLQRLRGGRVPPARPRLDQPTQPQDMG